MAQRGSARARVIDAALRLFAEYGVHATSLQMIADDLGVTKAAVYYQFHSKDDIVLAVVQPIFNDLSRVVRIAAAMPTAVSGRDALISGLIDTSIAHRRVMAVFSEDPVVHSLVKDHPEFSEVTEALAEMVAAQHRDVASRVTGAMIISGIFGASTDPRLADVDDDEMRRVLSHCSQQLLKLCTAEV
ncbi:TetR/AcrR family transcriptional regulator [Mycobacterium sp. ACS4331]|uniref:TetR/AcrR family transcriptional regulator n=1 Tax=Mycobacterium sp. ACS4331 TaxID=1834121 RepID=UPI003369BF85